MSRQPMLVCVVGVGFVGQHLVDAFSRCHRVIGLDLAPSRVAALQQHYAARTNVAITGCADGIGAADLFCIAVPTLIHPDGQSIDTSCVAAAVDTVMSHARPGATVVMESSVAVGMTRALLGSLRQRGVHVGFSPARVDPGRTFPAAEDIAKVVSGIDADSLAAVLALYSSVYTSVVPVSSLETAEMVKLFENCFRMVNIAYVNEVADSCAQFGICPHELVSAASTKPYGYMPFYSGAGVGGHCISVNPSYLLLNNDLPLLRNATEAMHKRPAALAARLAEDYPAATSFLVVGAAFKPGEVLTTHAPGEALAQQLIRMGKHVAVHDPLVRDSGGHAGLRFISDAEWSGRSLDACYDVVVVAMAQHGIDFGVLRHLKRASVLCYPQLPGIHIEAPVIHGGIPAAALLSTAAGAQFPPPPPPAAEQAHPFSSSMLGYSSSSMDDDLDEEDAALLRMSSDCSESDALALGAPLVRGGSGAAGYVAKCQWPPLGLIEPVV